MGNLLGVVVHAANLHDTKSGILPFRIAYKAYATIHRVCADMGYRKTFVNQVKEEFGLDVDITEKIKPHAWETLPWRWVVERTLSWLNHSRRLSKDYETLISSEEAMVKLSHLHTLLKRL